MFNTKIKVRGVKGVLEAVEQLSVEVQANVQKQVKETANAIRKSARAKVPVDTGGLKKSIRVKYSKDKWSAKVGAMGKNSAHAHLVEFGTVERTQKTTGRDTGKMPAKPFLFPSYEENRQEYINGMKNALKDAVKSV